MSYDLQVFDSGLIHLKPSAGKIFVESLLKHSEQAFFLSDENDVVMIDNDTRDQELSLHDTRTHLNWNESPAVPASGASTVRGLAFGAASGSGAVSRIEQAANEKRFTDIELSLRNLNNRFGQKNRFRCLLSGHLQ